ncbi:MAG: xanthine dehydrogenase family protein subunit M [Anaerolineales bacterium]|nr:xanthine dehydrogenase family protein subunit M [Anaerolineales bacterium]
MYPPKFDYYRAADLKDAQKLLKEHEGAKLMAGGHSLIPVMKLRLADPGTVIDIGSLDGLKGISVSGSTVNIGALTTHAMLAASSDLPQALSGAAACIGDPQVRNRGTIGGNIAHADPASDLPTVLLALGATIHMAKQGKDRSVAAADFFVDLFETALEEDELITNISLPIEGAGTGSAYAKLFNPASRYAMVGVAASVTMSGGKCTNVSVAIGGLTPKPMSCGSVAAALNGTAGSAADIAAAAAAVANDLGDEVMGDIHASAEYRRQMAPVFVRRALTAAIENAS